MRKEVEIGGDRLLGSKPGPMRNGVPKLPAALGMELVG
jgi:hypothetical protein